MAKSFHLPSSTASWQSVRSLTWPPATRSLCIILHTLMTSEVFGITQTRVSCRVQSSISINPSIHQTEFGHYVHVVDFLVKTIFKGEKFNTRNKSEVEVLKRQIHILCCKRAVSHPKHICKGLLKMRFHHICTHQKDFMVVTKILL